MQLAERRHLEIEKYRRVYRDFPNYTNKEVRIGLTREWFWRHRRDRGITTMLDVGCGLGEVVDRANRDGVSTRGCDVITTLTRGLEFDLISGVHDLGVYDDRAFDLVTCTDVMEHLLEDDVPAALSEIARVARGPVLLTICHRPDTPGKFGEDQLHITVHPRKWWEDKIAEHMGAEPKALYTDRVNENGTWFSVDCSKAST